MSIQTRLINRVAVRDFALAALAEHRPHLREKLTRVSGAFYGRAQAHLSIWIEQEIKAAPSLGKTIR